MYLQTATTNEIEKHYRAAIKNGGPGRIADPASLVRHISPRIRSEAAGAFLMSETGERLGYCYTTDEIEGSQYGRALIEIGLFCDMAGGLIRLLPNLYRSFNLDSILVRSDDAGLMQAMAHFANHFFHLCQVYRLPEDQEYGADAENLTLTKEKNGNRAKLLEKDDTNIFDADIFDHEQVEDDYRLTKGKSTIGSITVCQFGSNKKERVLYPVIRADKRGEGYGATMVSMVVDELLSSGLEPLMVISPDNHAGQYFLNRIGATPVFDLLKIRPQFHVVPMQEVEIS